MGIKVILGGPPHSGKSVLREGLKQAIRALPGAPYAYVITASPDGEGAWYQETVRNNPYLAAQLKSDYKTTFTRAFAERVAESVRLCQQPLTLVDLGGVVSKENKLIARYASHAVLIAAHFHGLTSWRELCAHLKLSIVAELRSDYDANEDRIEGIGSDGVLRGLVHHLKRGEDASGRPMVQVLAAWLADLASAARL